MKTPPTPTHPPTHPPNPSSFSHPPTPTHLRVLVCLEGEDHGIVQQLQSARRQAGPGRGARPGRARPPLLPLMLLAPPGRRLGRTQPRLCRVHLRAGWRGRREAWGGARAWYGVVCVWVGGGRGGGLGCRGAPACRGAGAGQDGGEEQQQQQVGGPGTCPPPFPSSLSPAPLPPPYRPSCPPHPSHYYVVDAAIMLYARFVRSVAGASGRVRGRGRSRTGEGCRGALLLLASAITTRRWRSSSASEAARTRCSSEARLQGMPCSLSRAWAAVGRGGVERGGAD